ncbi:MAG: alpha/beta fold hydrolase [Acidimicrobiales bacterium]
MLACVHGLEGSHLNWTAIGPRLAGTARVVAIDLVGHDRTPMAGRRADAEGRRRLLSGMLEALGEGPVTLIGNSMGGLVAALQAAVRPESVSPLVLIDPEIPVAPPGPVHPRVVANVLMCAVPRLGEGFLRLRRRHSSAEDTVWRTLTTCCVGPISGERLVEPRGGRSTDSIDLSLESLPVGPSQLELLQLAGCGAG